MRRTRINKGFTWDRFLPVLYWLEGVRLKVAGLMPPNPIGEIHRMLFSIVLKLVYCWSGAAAGAAAAPSNTGYGISTPFHSIVPGNGYVWKSIVVSGCQFHSRSLGQPERLSSLCGPKWILIY